MKTYKELPLIPLRGLTLFPYMVLHFDVGRDKSIKALDAAMMENQEIFLVTQKDARQEDPADGDIFEMGTICTIRQLLKLPGNTVRVLVEGFGRNEGRAFVELAAAIPKPVVVLKAGKTTEGSRAVSSHTASLAGDYRVFSDVLAQHGIVEAAIFFHR